MQYLPDNRFVWYARDWDAARGKWTKRPVNRHGVTIDAHDPSQWVSYAEAAAAATWDDSVAGPYGVAWVLNGDGWWFLDLDSCAVDGAWTADADLTWRSFRGALGEISTSGQGMHIFGRCDPSQVTDLKNRFDGNKEFYVDKRFVALSQAGPQPIGEWTDKDWTHQLRAIIPTREFLGELPDGVDPTYTGPEDDEELLRLALQSSSAAAAFGGKASFADLWNANAEVLGRFHPDPERPFDHSAADMALMSLLAFWTGKDMPRMDRLFRRSSLMRDKYATRGDYRRDTIGKAARMVKKVYDYARPASALPSTAPSEANREVYLTAHEMQEHFEGCIYILDVHRVLIPDGRLLKPEQFNALCGGHMFQMLPDATKATRKAFEAFTESSVYRGPQAFSMDFRPDVPFGEIDADTGAVNTYRPAAVKRVPGDVSPFLDLLRRLLPDPGDQAILLAYMAAVVQHPGVKFQWAPVLQGVEGNGKTALFSCVAYAVGREFVHEPNPKKLGNQFNGWVDRKLFVLVEEFHMNGRREILDELKALITNRWIEVETKGVDQRMQRNVANFAFCTNHRDAVLKNRNDRRYAVFFTAQQVKNDLKRDRMDGSYFPDLYKWLDGGGYSHVAAFLAAYEIPDELNPATQCHRAPRTSSYEDVIEAGIGGLEAEILEAIESGVPGFQGDWISAGRLVRLASGSGFRIGRNTLGKILVEMGYEKWGRAPRPIRVEQDDGGSGRPILWRKRDAAPATFEDYLGAQGASYV
jgi:hypothetical protein